MRLRAGVVGVGYLGRFHALKYAAHPDVDLVAVVDVDADRCRAVATEVGSEALFDHRKLIGRVDCVSVAVNTQHHHDVARDLLLAGIDVLVEKPLTTTVADGQELLELAVRGQRVLQVGHLERFNPAIRAIEAGRTIVLDRAQTLALADEAKIAVVAVDPALVGEG